MEFKALIARLFDFLPGDTRLDPSLPTGTVLIENVSKRFRRVTAKKKSYGTFKSGLLSGFGRETEEAGELAEPGTEDGVKYTTALNDVSIEIHPGTAIGIIGRNGSGKSSLLKLISGIYQPDSGRVRVSGNISALIELGTGFHPDFTGRENVYLGGIMYGLTKAEIAERFDSIVSYAELEDFIDDPVRTYSSGMYMRLGFSLAIHTNPDILLVDEVLAVGDASFISRCQETISDFKRRGKTLIFVTHDLPSVERWCDEVVWLDRGVMRDRGKPRRVIDKYMQKVDEGMEEQLIRANASGAVNPLSDGSEVEASSWGNKDVEIDSVEMIDSQGQQKWVFESGDSVEVRLQYKINSAIDDLVFGIGILRSDGLQIHGTNTEIDDMEVPVPEGVSFPYYGSVSYRIDRLELTEDSYFVDVAAHREDGLPFDYHHRQHRFSVRSSNRAIGVVNPAHSWEIEPDYTMSIEENTSKRKIGEVSK